ncbi:AAA family ATPase [Pandoraea nosoerga]|uniref:ATP-binding protein n=1 Tax=Pandoraea nosoerga TaxID=2508296 RepID=UPI00197D1E19|nr:ATP-binding protein [Pandoraea nosoerga]MBN4665401.1 AAA family ATPase [Pandoraea nosoerga]MBN4674926.1 AAA family ATPase [Pandoraea nosoerga]MBN4680242.1 AAA family ATPase [Pandoraea nosoerga]MBN4744525.1 AAA family ATPase [Pandoraea nosoerga]
MRLTHIHATNFLGIQTADVELRTPVALFCGPNGAGKSSIQDAVRLALAGESVRVALKKEYGRLVHDGAESGSIVVVADGGRANNVALPGGKITQTIPADPRLPFVLDAQRFASLDAKARRTFLFGLMGVTIGTDDVRQRLIARGITGDKVEAVLPLVRAGFEAAAGEAQTKATAAKGAWRAVTGETYGVVKASNWTAPAPEGAEDPDELATALAEGRQTIEDFEREAADLQRQLGEIDAADRQRQQRETRAAELRALAGKLPKAEESLERARAELAEFLPKVEALRAAAGGKVEGMPCTCPECGALLRYLAGKLAADTPVERNDEAAASLPEYEKSLTVLQNAVKSREAEFDRARDAAAQLELLAKESAADADDDAPARADVERALAEAKDRAAQARKIVAGIEASQRAVAEAAEKTKRAAQHHADVVAWDTLAGALGPDGIPADLLSEALAPINARMAAQSEAAGWATVAISAEMSITAAGRDYALLSESEKWRTDALIAEAIANLSGVRVLMLDRADVLVGAERDNLLYWLDDLAHAGEIDTAIVFMSMKAAPGQMPESITPYWIADHCVGMARAAA